MSRLYRQYPLGTKVQHRNGYILVKTEEGKEGPAWIAESRWVWQQHRGELQEGDKIFHIDGNRENNHISNLAKIHYNQTKFVFLKESRVLYLPPGAVRVSPRPPRTNVRQLATGKYRHLRSRSAA